MVLSEEQEEEEQEVEEQEVEEQEVEVVSDVSFVLSDGNSD